MNHLKQQIIRKVDKVDVEKSNEGDWIVPKGSGRGWALGAPGAAGGKAAGRPREPPLLQRKRRRQVGRCNKKKLNGICCGDSD
jgi:hypothetical protein